MRKCRRCMNEGNGLMNAGKELINQSSAGFILRFGKLIRFCCFRGMHPIMDK